MKIPLYVAVVLGFKFFLRTLAHQFGQQNISGAVMELCQNTPCVPALPSALPQGDGGWGSTWGKTTETGKNVLRRVKSKETIKVSLESLPRDLKQCLR